VCTSTPSDCKISTTYLSLFAPAHPGKFILHQHAVSLRLCLRVWRGREGKAWEKKNEQVEEIEENGR